MTQPLLQAADLRGAARLTTEAVTSLASLVEAMHVRITSPPRVPGLGGMVAANERMGGVTGLGYETVRGVPHLAGETIDALLGCLAPALAVVDSNQPPHPEREAILAALNGVLGDHLATTDNPLAITMQFRREGLPLLPERHAVGKRLGRVTPRLMVLLHGLCMNDLQWHRAGHDHGEAMARELGYTPVYLHYNSGLSVSTNGRILARLMDSLYSAWPMPLERLVMLGHSMGGLVARSAIHHGAQMRHRGLRWPEHVTDLVCLGTPHLGAPLERVGHGVELLLGVAPYAAPLARLGKARSAGINDLRQGNILKGLADEDGIQQADLVKLPGSTRCFAIAASLGSMSVSMKARLLDDGLVPVASALGMHGDSELCLGFPPEHQAIVYRTSHLNLLSSTEVYGLLRRWLN